jgi:uncharacterized membrane protein YdbT with pleckstrin-like domain
METKTARRPAGRSNESDLPVALREGERILAKGFVSYGIYWRSVVAFAFAAMVAFLAVQLGVFLAFVGLVVFVYEFLRRKLLLMYVTNQRVILRSGIIKIDTVQVRLDRIESVEIQRTLMGHLMGYATIIITGTGTRLAFIPYLDNAPHIRNVLDDLLYQREKAQKEESARSGPSPLSEPESNQNSARE